MINFFIALELILKLEGGPKITNDPRDPGGLTRFGISLRSFPELGPEGIVNLTREKAAEIYREHYWDKIHGDNLPIDIAICVFDCAVNQGPGTAVKLLQEAVGAPIDGRMGRVTIQAISKVNPDWLIREFLTLRQRRYVQTYNYSDYGKGWIRRLFHICQGATIAKDLKIGR